MRRQTATEMQTEEQDKPKETEAHTETDSGSTRKGGEKEERKEKRRKRRCSPQEMEHMDGEESGGAAHRRGKKGFYKYFSACC